MGFFFFSFQSVSSSKRTEVANDSVQLRTKLNSVDIFLKKLNELIEIQSRRNEEIDVWQRVVFRPIGSSYSVLWFEFYGASVASGHPVPPK